MIVRIWLQFTRRGALVGGSVQAPKRRTAAATYHSRMQKQVLSGHTSRVRVGLGATAGGLEVGLFVTVVGMGRRR